MRQLPRELPATRVGHLISRPSYLRSFPSQFLELQIYTASITTNLSIRTGLPSPFLLPRKQPQWYIRYYFGLALVRVLQHSSTFHTPSIYALYLTCTMQSRPRRAVLATGDRNAPLLQQGITLGIPHFRRRGREFRILVDGSGE